MCDFPSWIKDGNKVYFLTDKEVNQRIRANPYLKVIDCIGHSAISRHLNVYGDHIEGFSRIPKEFVKAIQAGKCKKMMASVGIQSVKFNDKGQLHCITGPAVVYKKKSYNQHFVNGNVVWNLPKILSLLKALKVKATTQSILSAKKILNW